MVPTIGMVSRVGSIEEVRGHCIISGGRGLRFLSIVKGSRSFNLCKKFVNYFVFLVSL
jgi:hypothetical protein